MRDAGQEVRRANKSRHQELYHDFREKGFQVFADVVHDEFQED